MNRRLAILALALYPLAYRRRYGEEMRALLDETSTRMTTVLDLLRGALVAHVRPPSALAGTLDPADRVRASAAGVLGSWVLFAAAGFAFYSTTEDSPFTVAGHGHPLLGDVHRTVQVLALVGSLALLFGALPLILGALAQARRQPSLRRLVTVPALAVLVFACLTAALAVIGHSDHSGHPTTAAGLALIAWGLAGLACGAACVIASRTALFAVPASPSRLVSAFACGTLVTLTMVAMSVAVACYAIALPIDAGGLAGSANGPLQAVSAGASLVAVAIVMVLAATLAATSTRRGWRAALQLRAGA